ncbi:MAG: putative Ig domain-containing protein [Acidobacteria bacterium]|nr:putative Ig domain-containing protein [Acidobacteriota bacterium]
MKKLLILFIGASLAVWGQSIRTNSGFYQNFVPRNDDGSSAATPLGFSINFFGKVRDSAFVNNNGNITFDNALATYTPFGLQKTSREIIAPFFADVDTRGPASTVLTYGQDTVNGHKAFAANYVDVGYYQQHDDKRNRFQVVVIDRSDTGAGNFNIEFNYERIVWETGDASGGTNGYGGTPATVGWSNGTTDGGSSFQLEGSMVSGVFLDSGSRALIRAHLNTSQVGRLLFQARDGSISQGLQILSNGSAPAAITGSAYDYTFQATGVSGAITWELIPDIAMPDGVTFANGHLTGVPTTPGTYTFTVSATANIDGESVTVSKRGSITVGVPTLTIATGCPLPDGLVGSSYSALFTAQGATPASWKVADTALLPPGVTISPRGLLAGVPTLAGSYRFTVWAMGASGSGIVPVQKTCGVTIQAASVRMTNGCSLPDATIGVPYSQTLTMEGGVGPYTFELYGQLPLGLALTNDGRVIGNPSVAAYNPFQVKVTDTRRTTTVQSCAITVNDPVVGISSGCPLPAATTGMGYTAQFAASGGTSPYTWSVAGTLPQGLTFTPDGRLSGAPMAAGAFQFRLIASDSSGRQAGKPCSLPVISGPMSIGSCPMPEATVGTPYGAALSPLGGSAPYVWSLAGALPAGLRLSTTTGWVDGTPTVAGEFAFNLSLRDASMQAITQPCSLRVRPLALGVSGNCPAPAATVGQLYVTRFTAQGGVAPYQFDFPGRLPDGLTASSDGVISGTPGSVGPAAFGVRVTDASGAVAQSLCSMDVALPKAPAVRFTPMLRTVAAADGSLKIGVELDKSYPLPVTGRVTLTVTPDTASLAAAANEADPQVRFSNGQLAMGFSIPAGSTRADLPLISTGTVASTISAAMTSLRAADADLPAVVAPIVVQVPAAPPIVTSACFTKSTAVILLTVVGATTTRELTSAAVTAGSATRSTDLNGVSSDYFSDARTVRTGGAFSLQFTLDSAFQSSSGPFTLVLSNTVGKSASITAQRCP